MKEEGGNICKVLPIKKGGGGHDAEVSTSNSMWLMGTKPFSIISETVRGMTFSLKMKRQNLISNLNFIPIFFCMKCSVYKKSTICLQNGLFSITSNTVR